MRGGGGEAALAAGGASAQSPGPDGAAPTLTGSTASTATTAPVVVAFSEPINGVTGRNDRRVDGHGTQSVYAGSQDIKVLESAGSLTITCSMAKGIDATPSVAYVGNRITDADGNRLSASPVTD